MQKAAGLSLPPWAEYSNDLYLFGNPGILLPDYIKKTQKVDVFGLFFSVMKIRISTIPPQGLKISDSIPLAPLNTRMNEGRNNDISFVEAPQVELMLYRTISGAQAKGKASTKYRQPCSRCLDVIERDLEVDINLIIEPRPEKESVDPLQPDDCQDDIGLAYYDGDHIDLEDIIQESLILGLSQFWHPPSDERGTCTLCGRNLAEETGNCRESRLTLGVLLKKAGI